MTSTRELCAHGPGRRAVLAQRPGHRLRARLGRLRVARARAVADDQQRIGSVLLGGARQELHHRACAFRQLTIGSSGGPQIDDHAAVVTESEHCIGGGQIGEQAVAPRRFGGCLRGGPARQGQLGQTRGARGCGARVDVGADGPDAEVALEGGEVALRALERLAFAPQEAGRDAEQMRLGRQLNGRLTACDRALGRQALHVDHGLLVQSNAGTQLEGVGLARGASSCRLELGQAGLFGRKGLLRGLDARLGARGAGECEGLLVGRHRFLCDDTGLVVLAVLLQRVRLVEQLRCYAGRLRSQLLGLRGGGGRGHLIGICQGLGGRGARTTGQRQSHREGWQRERGQHECA